MDSQTPAQRLLENADGIFSDRLKRLYRHWSQLRGSRMAPVRADLNPAEMRDQLGWIWLMDVIDNGADFRFRLGGDRVIQFFGQRLAGETLRDVSGMSPAFFGRFMDLAQMAVTSRSPVIAGPAQAQYEPRAFLQVEAMLLPLSDDGVNVSTLIGSIEIQPLIKAPEPRDV